MHAHDRRFFSLSQKGTHSPSLHLPMSTQTVSSGAFPGGGHSLLFPTDGGQQSGRTVLEQRAEHLTVQEKKKGKQRKSRLIPGGNPNSLFLAFICRLPVSSSKRQLQLRRLSTTRALWHSGNQAIGSRPWRRISKAGALTCLLASRKDYEEEVNKWGSEAELQQFHPFYGKIQLILVPSQ